MIIETMAVVACSVLPAMGGASGCGGVALPPSAAQVAVTSLDGVDGRGVWVWHKTVGYDVRENIRVADRPMYPAGRVDSVRRPGFNGMAWRGETFVGGVERYATDSGSPGAMAYGASGDEGVVANLRVGPYVIGINPFEEIRAEGKEIPRQILTKMEDARNQWLKDRGYVGGVRTFRNPAAPAAAKQAIDLTPKAVIPAPTDLPRVRNRMEVRATTPMMNLAGATRVSMPNQMMADRSPPRLASK
ncbi:MAG: hypothetical protein HEQ23_08420 [Tepidisphaera sp.]